APGSPRIAKERVHHASAFRARGLEAESANARRQWQVVVDGFRNVAELQVVIEVLLRVFGDFGGRIESVVTTDGDQMRDTNVFEGLHRGAKVLFLLGGIGPRSAQNAAALAVDAG